MNKTSQIKINWITASVKNNDNELFDIAHFRCSREAIDAFVASYKKGHYGFFGKTRIKFVGRTHLMEPRSKGELRMITGAFHIGNIDEILEPPHLENQAWLIHKMIQGFRNAGSIRNQALFVSNHPVAKSLKASDIRKYLEYFTAHDVQSLVAVLQIRKELPMIAAYYNFA